MAIYSLDRYGFARLLSLGEVRRACVETVSADSLGSTKDIKELEKTKPVLANLTKSAAAKKEAADKFLLASRMRKKPDPNPKKINLPEIMAKPFRW
jgi:hypothetical protein